MPSRGVSLRYTTEIGTCAPSFAVACRYSLAYFDVFWISAVVAATLIVLVLMLRRSVAEKGAHVAAE